MPVHEYKVIPAPSRPQKAKGVKTTAEKFALALTTLMNEMGRDGWDYVRAETLPCEEAKGWTGRKDTSFQTMLVFRRDADMARALPEAAAAPVAVPRLWPAGAALPGLKPPINAVAPEGAAPPVVPAPVVAPPVVAAPAGRPDQG